MNRHALVSRIIGGVIVGLIATAGLSTSVVAGPTVYSQPPLFGNGDSFPAEINGGQQADNWVANTSSTITMLRWWGTNSGIGASPGSYTLRVFSNAGGLPGSLVDQIVIGNAATKTNTGEADFNGRDIYKYEANLPGGFVPTMGATYWINVMNDVAAGGPPFMWHQGDGPDEAHAFRVGAGSWNPIDGDMAFELIAAAPPACIPDIAPRGGNQTVNVDDLLLVINSWGARPPPCPPSCAADIAPPGGNCIVNTDDLLAVINGWGPCP